MLGDVLVKSPEDQEPLGSIKGELRATLVEGLAKLGSLK